MPNPRRFLFLSLAAVMVKLTVAWVVWPRSAITRENVARIQRGMTRIEVEAILGGPARHDSTGPTRVVPAEVDLGLEHPKYPLDMLQRRWVDHILNTAPRRPNTDRWESDETILWVQWSADGTVTECDSLPLRREAINALDMLAHWLDW